MPLPDVPSLAGVLTSDQVACTASAIAAVQEPNGAIPWFAGGHTDVWDHVESAMALTAAGRRIEADRAYGWMLNTQRPDGSWPIRIDQGTVTDPGSDTNFCAYLATGVWHRWLVTADYRATAQAWPAVKAALGFVVALQCPRGEIVWARGAGGVAVATALLAGSSSIYLSLRCGLALAELMGESQPDWELAAGLLRHALRLHPEAFERKDCFSMDWYYPVLAGPFEGGRAMARLDQRWEDFVVPGLGARCVDDHPWVTGAETAELALALDVVGDMDRAVAMVSSMQHLREDDGAYWTGYVYADGARWPVEQSSWTAGAVILAVDALSNATGGAGLFRGEGLPQIQDIVGDDCGCRDAAPSADRVASIATYTLENTK
ncbi:MAG TPA: prenyltransferase [Dermatophilaceae bacterium]